MAASTKTSRKASASSMRLKPRTEHSTSPVAASRVFPVRSVHLLCLRYSDIERFYTCLIHVDRIPIDRHGGIGLKDGQFTVEQRRRGCSVDDIFNNAITDWHTTFQQAVLRQNEYPRPPRSRRAWYSLDGLPMAPSAQIEKNQELFKIWRQQSFKNLQAMVLTNRLRGPETGARETVSAINYSMTYSHQ